MAGAHSAQFLEPRRSQYINMCLCVSRRRRHAREETGGESGGLQASRKASLPIVSRSGWEADTRPAELLPLGAREVIADRSWGGLAAPRAFSFDEQDESEIEKCELADSRLPKRRSAPKKTAYMTVERITSSKRRRTECPHSARPPGAVAQKAVISSNGRPPKKRSGTANLYSAGTVIRGPRLSEVMTP
jgi:hypothetical protein